MEEQPQLAQQNQKKKNSAGFYILVFLIVVIGYLVFGYFYKNTATPSNSPAPTSKDSTILFSDYFSYPGHTGRSALQLLKEKAQVVEEDSTGMVSNINGRKANKDAHEYWAFYIDGKQAMIGASEYQTKNGEKIEWRIEKY